MSEQRQTRGSDPRKGWESTDKVTSEPWGPTQPALEQIIGQAGSNFNTGVGTQLPSFSPVAPIGQTSLSAIQGLQNYVNNPSPLSQSASSSLQGILTGNLGNNDQFNAVYDRAMGPSAAETYLSGMAQGPGQTNPYLERILGIGNEQITNRVNSLQSAKGRYGGLGAGGHVDALGEAISNFQTPILYNAYEGDRNRQLQAVGMLDNARLSGAGLGLSAAGSAANADLARNNLKLGAASTAGMLDQSRLGAYNTLLGAGAYQDQNAQAQRQAEYDRWLWENGGADQAALQQYLGTVGSIAGLGGSQTQLEPRRPGEQILGIGSTIAGIAGSLAPFMLSDERAKEDIKRVGKTDGGNNVYTYRYKGDPVTHMGVMAQETAKKQPEAVGMFTNGLLAVDYSKVA